MDRLADSNAGEGEMKARLDSLVEETDLEFVLDLIKLYVTEGEAVIAEILRSASSGEWKALERSAHSLKGASANVGAVELVRACQEAELSARSGGVQAGDIERIGRLFGSAIEILRTIQGRLEAESG
jgi:HPt (histidine-containing phosphotransfer) domain-containing protein